MGDASRLQKLMAMHEKDPQDAFCLYGIAQEHAKVGQHAEALSWYDRAIAADPTSAYAFFHKARSLVELSRKADAVSTLTLGLQAARLARDNHAASELQGFLDELEGDE